MRPPEFLRLKQAIRTLSLFVVAMARKRKLSAPKAVTKPKASRTRALVAPSMTKVILADEKSPGTRSRTLAAPAALARQLVARKLEEINLPTTEEELSKILDVRGRKRKSSRLPFDEETSESSSDGEPTVGKPKRQRQLTAGVKRRMAKYVDYMMEEGSTGLSVLERVAVTKAVDKNYLALVEKLENHLKEQDVDLDMDDAKIDQEIVQYMNKLWLKGVKAHTGNHLLAGWMHKHAAFSKAGTRSIPRS